MSLSDKELGEIVSSLKLLQNKETQLMQRERKLKDELKEHDSVVRQLEKVNGGRKCLRMISGKVLEKTAALVLVEMQESKALIGKSVEIINTQLDEVREEIKQLAGKYGLFEKLGIRGVN